MTAMLLGLPAIALSQAFSDRGAVPWDTARAHAPAVSRAAVARHRRRARLPERELPRRAARACRTAHPDAPGRGSGPRHRGRLPHRSTWRRLPLAELPPRAARQPAGCGERGGLAVAGAGSDCRGGRGVRRAGFGRPRQCARIDSGTPLAGGRAKRGARASGPAPRYGTFGFGYIVPATFLPAMAWQPVSDPLVFGLTWPLFGLAAALSVVIAARWLSEWPRRRVWALAQGTMALGTALRVATQTSVPCRRRPCWWAEPSWSPPWLACSWRAASPRTRHRWWPRTTVAFAAGQIAGPLLVRLLGPGKPAGLDALAWANAASTVPPARRHVSVGDGATPNLPPNAEVSRIGWRPTRMRCPAFRASASVMPTRPSSGSVNTA